MRYEIQKILQFLSMQFGSSLVELPKLKMQCARFRQLLPRFGISAHHEAFQ